MPFFGAFGPCKIGTKRTFGTIFWRLWHRVLNEYPTFADGMEKIHERRLRIKDNSSFFVVVPSVMVQSLGLRSGEHIRFHDLGGKIVLTPGGKSLSKKDLTDIDRYERAFDEAMKEGSQKSEGSPAGEAAPRMSALEKFRIK